MYVSSAEPKLMFSLFVGFAKFADGLCSYFDARLHFDTHLSGQATESYVERSDAFGFVSHEASPGAYLAAAAAYNLSTLLAIG